MQGEKTFALKRKTKKFVIDICEKKKANYSARKITFKTDEALKKKDFKMLTSDEKFQNRFPSSIKRVVF